MKNIAAFTALHPPQEGLVEYISVNRAGEYDELVETTMRERTTGKQVSITMTKQSFALFLIDAMKSL